MRPLAKWATWVARAPRGPPVPGPQAWPPPSPGPPGRPSGGPNGTTSRGLGHPGRPRPAELTLPLAKWDTRVARAPRASVNFEEN